MMRKLFALAVILALFPAATLAQASFNLDLEVRAEWDNVSTQGGGVDHDASGFHGSMANIKIFGDLTPGLHYLYRQRLTEKTFDGRSLFDSIDMALITYETARWRFALGKNAIALGGYEIDSTPIDEYWYCDHSNALSGYLVSVGATYKFDRHQMLTLQLSQSPYSRLDGKPADMYAVNLMWTGRVLPKWETIWSANLLQQDLDGHCIDYLSLGNRLVIGPGHTLDVDFMWRGLVAMPARGLKAGFDFSGVVKYGFRMSDYLELQCKLTRDRNSGVGIDLLLPDGADSWTFGGGLCWYPKGTTLWRVFAMAGKAVDNGTASVAYASSPLRLMIGTTWKVNMCH